MGEAINAALPAHPAVDSTSIAGPGFVNVVISNRWLGERIDAMLVNGITTWAPALSVSLHSAFSNCALQICARVVLCTRRPLMCRLLPLPAIAIIFCGNSQSCFHTIYAIGCGSTDIQC